MPPLTAALLDPPATTWVDVVPTAAVDTVAAVVAAAFGSGTPAAAYCAAVAFGPAAASAAAAAVVDPEFVSPVRALAS